MVLLHSDSDCGLMTDSDSDFWLVVMTEGDSDSDSDTKSLGYSSEVNLS